MPPYPQLLLSVGIGSRVKLGMHINHKKWYLISNQLTTISYALNEADWNEPHCQNSTAVSWLINWDKFEYAYLVDYEHDSSSC